MFRSWGTKATLAPRGQRWKLVKLWQIMKLRWKMKMARGRIGITYIGCAIQAGALWCQEERGPLTSCPETDDFESTEVDVPIVGDQSYFSTAGLKVEISEIMANNEITVEDEDGERSDWIEVHNLENKERVSVEEQPGHAAEQTAPTRPTA
eukprot:TRINITY_DN186_c1_g1_i3.p3 TRINITY_DN186_c1_g1~~TRINITY_DN186_c1_g1_i3.p3  ORF type:complete len:151 (-),score=21.84 TRINITY_DN186_c1_g1_i3:23-475(-)